MKYDYEEFVVTKRHLWLYTLGLYESLKIEDYGMFIYIKQNVEYGCITSRWYKRNQNK